MTDATQVASTSAQWVHLLVQRVIIVPPVLLVCGASFALMERPCMERDWQQKLAARLHGRATAA